MRQQKEALQASARTERDRLLNMLLERERFDSSYLLTSTTVQILTQHTFRSNDEAAQRAKVLESNAFSIVERTLNALQESERARKAAGVFAKRERE